MHRLQSPVDQVPGPDREYLDALAEISRDIVLVRDAEGLITYCSPAVHASLGYRPEDLEGTTEAALFHPVDLVIRDGLIARLLKTDVTQPPAELRVRSKSGAWRWLETIDTNALENPAVRGIVTNARDVTERRTVEAELVELSLRDALTGLPNRLLVIDRMGTALARTARADDVMAVLLCDMDAFNAVNECAGHEGGDRVLVEVARRLEQVLDETDTLARTGGDSFVVLREGLGGMSDATALASRICEMVTREIAVDGFEGSVSVSIGIVVVTGAEAATADPTTLLRNADAAVHRAKTNGSPCWALCDESVVSAATYRQELEPELRRALKADDFVLHYQPVYDLNDGTIVGVEALLRWDNPARGLLPPADFIGLAEESGLIVAIGSWVLNEACNQMREWSDELGWPGWVSVNLSARQVSEPGLASSIRGILAASGLRARLLRLELTETSMMRAGHAAVAELEAIRGLGVHIGLDDFGTGYASLTNVQQLPVDFLKIDRSFVVTLQRGPRRGDNGNAIVEAVSLIGKTLDLETIAEGVETEEQAELLREFGCPYAQGFQLARPASADDIAVLLTSSNGAAAESTRARRRFSGALTP